MLALGLLARLESSPVRNILPIAIAVPALIFYSLYCDPLWSVTSAMSWAVPLAVVAFSPLRIKAIVLRCAVLTAPVVLLSLSGPLLYSSTLLHSTAHVFFI